MNGAVYILLAAILWGTTGTSQALAPAGATPMSIGAMRLIVGGAALLVVAMLRGGVISLRMPRRAVFAGGLFVALYQVCFFAGVSMTGVAVGTIVAIGSSPVFAGIIAYVVRGERLDGRWYAATVLAVIGCALLSVVGQTVTADPVGIAFALGAGVSYAGYTTASKVLLAGGNTPDGVMAVIFSTGAVFLAPLLLFTDLSWLAQPAGIGAALHLGIMTTALSYWFFARGLAMISVGTVATLSLAEPLTAALLGTLLLGERLTPFGIIGAVLIFIGLSLLALPRTIRRRISGA